MAFINQYGKFIDLEKISNRPIPMTHFNLPTWLSNLNHDLSKLHEAILLYGINLLKIENSAFVANSCGVPKSILFAWYEYQVNTNTLLMAWQI